MPFVKLDTGILHSTLWFERDARELFITALLMAEPFELQEELPQLKVEAIEPTGFNVPPGWYGFVRAAGIGIIRQSGMNRAAGLKALENLGNPDTESRSSEYEGRRMVRVNGGYIILNYVKYRERDTNAAERMRRFRKRQKELHGNHVTVTRNVTHSRGGEGEGEAEGEAEVEVEKVKGGKRPKRPKRPPSQFTQSDFDERDMRKIAASRKKLDERRGARVGSDSAMTNGEYFGIVAEETGISVKRILQLIEQMKQWPTEKAK